MRILAYIEYEVSAYHTLALGGNAADTGCMGSGRIALVVYIRRRTANHLGTRIADTTVLHL